MRRLLPPLSVAKIVDGWLNRHGGEAAVLAQLWQRWPELVGERVAAHTAPSSLRDGLLVVNVAGSAWLNELTFLRAPMIERMATSFGGRIRQVRFVAGAIADRRGAVTPPARRDPRPTAPIDKEAAAVLDALPLGRVEDERLRRAIFAARLAQLRNLGR